MSTEGKIFLGASTAAHQVEGGKKGNQHERWELENASNSTQNWKEVIMRPANIMGGKVPEEFLASVEPTATIRENYISGDAVNHYEQYASDFEIAKELGHTAHRFSIEWSRICPALDKMGNIEIDKVEIDHYRDVIKSIRDNGMEPMVTLWHFTEPAWFSARGGFANIKNVEYYLEFVEVIVNEFKEDVKIWIPFNEPQTHTFTSMLDGKLPPGKQTLDVVYRTVQNLIFAHKETYKLIHTIDEDARVGIAKNNTLFIRQNNDPVIFILYKALNYAYNYYFLDRVRQHLDFIGLNFYQTVKQNRNLYKNILKNQDPGVITSFVAMLRHLIPKSSINLHEEGDEYSDLGWRLNPDGLGQMVSMLGNRYKNLPIIITEHGVADSNDTMRAGYVERSLKSLMEVIQRENIRVDGYMHWSLLDNYEWLYGFIAQFGLVAVDRTNGYKRTIKKSAQEISEQMEKFTTEIQNMREA